MIEGVRTRVVGERSNLNESRLALEQPFSVWITAPDRVVARGRLGMLGGRSRAIEEFVEMTHELESLLHQIFERGQKELLGLLDLELTVPLTLQVGNVLLETIGELDEISKLISVFSDRLIVVINSSCFVAFDNGSQFGVQEPQFLFHLLFRAYLNLIELDFDAGNKVSPGSSWRSYIHFILCRSLKSSPAI